jgi:hypothetical protein
MSITLSVKTDITRAQRKLGPEMRRKIDIAAMRGINRGLDRTKTKAKTAIKDYTNMKPKAIAERLRIRKASLNYLRGTLQAYPYAPNLIEFMTKGAINRFLVRKKRRGQKMPTPPDVGIKAKIYNKQKTFKGAFIGRGQNSGKHLVFARTGPTRTAKLKALPGASVRVTFMQEEINKALRQNMRTVFVKEFNRQIDRLVKR